MARDLSKEDLYNGVKTLVEAEAAHIHLDQHKLFTLFSVAFQYLLYKSTKEPGAYIIRIEDSQLMDKLCRKSKDQSTRRFLQSLSLPRRFKYQASTFYLDFFNLNTWAQTSEIPKSKLKAALIVKNTSSKPMEFMSETDLEEQAVLDSLPPNYYLTSLQDNVPKTIIIAFESVFENTTKIQFPFIKKEEPRSINGVRLSKDIDLDKLDQDE